MHEQNILITYWKKEKRTMAAVFISGMIYNVGMLVGPVFIGKMIDALVAKKSLGQLMSIAICFVMSILFVQLSRSMKRFYIRRFANNTSASMRTSLYNSLLYKEKKQIEDEKLGSLMTKVISDVDACVEGMRKFTTEIFDTGVLLVSYLITMVVYDLKITVLASVFIPIAMVIAEKLKKVIYKYTSSYKKEMGKLSEVTFERVDNSLLYRIYGRDQDNRKSYEEQLKKLEKKAILANIWENMMQPIYNVIAMIGVLIVITEGGMKVMAGSWSIGVFSAYMSIFAAMAFKASKAAKLFNSVQKAMVSWKRIKPYMEEKHSLDKHLLKEEAVSTDEVSATVEQECIELSIQHLNFGYENEPYMIKDLNLSVNKGEIVGITGPVACGKSTLGKLFLGGFAYEGRIQLCGNELMSYTPYGRSRYISYLGHEPHLLSDTIYNNITLGDEGEIDKVLDIVCFKEDLAQMEKGILTLVGNGGVRLSGGQQARIALARALYHKTPLIVLDDPFSAVDMETEKKIIEKMRAYQKESMIILISHRLAVFSSLDQVVLMKEDHSFEYGIHEELLKTSPEYHRLYTLGQGEGEGHHAK